jgi:hypothetical protein
MQLHHRRHGRGSHRLPLARRSGGVEGDLGCCGAGDRPTRACPDVTRRDRLGVAVPGAVMIGPLFPALLAAAQAGDEQAFAVLWRDLQPAVLRYLRVTAPAAAEDLAADAWVSVIRGFARFRGDEQEFRTWVFTAARHRAIDWHRQAARRPTASLPVALLAERPGAVRVLTHRGLRRLARRLEAAGLARGVTR